MPLVSVIRGVSLKYAKCLHKWKLFKSVGFYHPPTKLREGNVFTPACHSVQREGVYDVIYCLAAWSHVPSGGGSPCQGGLPPERCLSQGCGTTP